MQKCDACGSNRIVAGKVSAGEGLFFEFSGSEFKEENYWTTFHILGADNFVFIRNLGNAKLCLDCGKVDSSFTVDVKEAKKVVDKWGTDALKARLE